MSIALESGQQNWKQRRHTLAAHPIGCLPQHDQRSANCLIIERCPTPDLAALGGGSIVQYANRGLLVIVSCRYELRFVRRYRIETLPTMPLRAGR
jgi:hypothetical protein